MRRDVTSTSIRRHFGTVCPLGIIKTKGFFYPNLRDDFCKFLRAPVKNKTGNGVRACYQLFYRKAPEFLYSVEGHTVSSRYLSNECHLTLLISKSKFLVPENLLRDVSNLRLRRKNRKCVLGISEYFEISVFGITRINFMQVYQKCDSALVDSLLSTETACLIRMSGDWFPLDYYCIFGIEQGSQEIRVSTISTSCGLL